jgi:RHS repeat-associated protein
MQGAGGVGGLLMVSEISNSQISNYYPTYDGNGNVSEYLDSTGTVVAHYEYDPFGKTTVATGPKANNFAHRFSTKPLDATTGLYYYGYRFYDPNSGRWPSRDPIGERGGLNLYGFVGNNAVNWVDVLGLSKCVPVPNNTRTALDLDQIFYHVGTDTLLSGRSLHAEVRITHEGEGKFAAFAKAESFLGVIITDNESGFRSGSAEITCKCNEKTNQCEASASSSTSGSSNPPRAAVSLEITAQASGDTGTITIFGEATARNYWGTIPGVGVSIGDQVNASASKSITVKCEKR